MVILSRKVGSEVCFILSISYYVNRMQQQPASAEQRLGVTWRVVSYKDASSLTEALTGIHTVLSFIQLLSDANQESQKNLIDAAIAAGVKRFAPSEYGR